VHFFTAVFLLFPPGTPPPLPLDRVCVRCVASPAHRLSFCFHPCSCEAPSNKRSARRNRPSRPRPTPTSRRWRTRRCRRPPSCPTTAPRPTATCSGTRTPARCTWASCCGVLAQPVQNESAWLAPLNAVVFSRVAQTVRVFGQRGGDGDAAAQRAQGEGDETHRYPPGGAQLRPPAGPAPGGHEPHAGNSHVMTPYPHVTHN